jgi:hypothetical protein
MSLLLFFVSLLCFLNFQTSRRHNQHTVYNIPVHSNNTQSPQSQSIYFIFIFFIHQMTMSNPLPPPATATAPQQHQQEEDMPLIFSPIAIASCLYLIASIIAAVEYYFTISASTRLQVSNSSHSQNNNNSLQKQQHRRDISPNPMDIGESIHSVVKLPPPPPPVRSPGEENRRLVSATCQCAIVLLHFCTYYIYFYLNTS